MGSGLCLVKVTCTANQQPTQVDSQISSVIQICNIYLCCCWDVSHYLFSQLWILYLWGLRLWDNDAEISVWREIRLKRGRHCSDAWLCIKYQSILGVQRNTKERMSSDNVLLIGSVGRDLFDLWRFDSYRECGSWGGWWTTSDKIKLFRLRSVNEVQHRVRWIEACGGFQFREREIPGVDRNYFQQIKLPSALQIKHQTELLWLQPHQENDLLSRIN